MTDAAAERQVVLLCYLAFMMNLIEVVTGILPHLTTQSNNKLCFGDGTLNHAIERMMFINT